MIQKPLLNNGQKIIHDAISKTSSAESHQQQQQQRKGERPSHVQDVAKSGNGGHHHFASNGVPNGHVENGRNYLSNGSNGLVHAPQNGNQGRQDGNAHGHANGRPAPTANGNCMLPRPHAYGGLNPSAGGKPGGKLANHGPNVGTVAGSDGKHSGAGPTVQSALGGGRGRDTGAAGGSHSNGGPAAIDNGGVSGIEGGRSRDARRRGPRGRGGSEATPTGAQPSINGNGLGPGSFGGATPERLPDKVGRPRPERRPRSALQETAAANGNPVSESDHAIDANGGRAPINHEDAERGGQRSGRARARRGRGGQQGGPAGAAGEQDDEVQRAAPATQSGGNGPDGQPERPPRQPRQRPPKAPRPPSQIGAMDGGVTAPTDGQLPQNGAGKQQRKPREPRPPSQQQQQLGQGQKSRPHDPEAGERDSAAPEAIGRGAGRGRGGRRRNGGGSDAGGTAGGSLEAAAGHEAFVGQQPDGEGASTGRRQRPPRPPRQQPPPPPPPPQPPLQQPSQMLDQPAAATPSLVAEQVAAPQDVNPAFQPTAAPMQPVDPVPHPPADFLVQAGIHMPQQPQTLLGQHPPSQEQQQYPPPPPFQDGQQLLDFSQQHQQLLQHMLPQHQYPPMPEFQQQHFLQQHQFEPAFQQFQQQLLQQHLAPPPGPGAHNYMPGPFNGPGGPMGGAGPLPPAFFAPGVNAYGQMLAPPQFGSMSPGSHVQQANMAPAPPGPQRHMVPPQDFLMGPHPAHQLMQPQQPEGPIPPSALDGTVTPQEHEAVAEAKPAATVVPSSEAASTDAAVAAEPTPAVDAPAVDEAVGAPLADSVPDVPQAEPVKNEWADRLAQQALARMNAVKSSLISGSGSYSAGLRGGVDERTRGAGAVARPAAYSNGTGGGLTSPRASVQASGNGHAVAETDAARRGYGDLENGARRNGSSVTNMPDTWRNGSTSSGTAPTGDAANGWRASLAPTGAADAADAWRARGTADEAPEVQAPAPYQPPRREESPPPPPPTNSSAAAASATGRPKLNLQPRTKPLPLAPAPGSGGVEPPAAANGPAGPAVANSSTSARPSIFGAARPREEVLRERGVTEPERLTVSNVAYANGSGSVGVAVRGGGRPGSVTSGASDEDQWQTVGKGGRSKPPPASADVGNALLDATSDPFFTGRTTGVTVVGRNIPSGRPFGGGSGQYGSGSYGKGSYGSHGAGSGDTYMNAYGASRGYGNTHGNDDDEPIFKRSLPTRSDGLF